MLTSRIALSIFILSLAGFAGGQQLSDSPLRLDSPAGLAGLTTGCPLPENYVSMSRPKLAAELISPSGLRATDGTYTGTTSQGRSFSLVVSGDKVMRFDTLYTCPGRNPPMTVIWPSGLTITGGSFTYTDKPFDFCVMPVIGSELIGTVDSATEISGTLEVLDGNSTFPCCTLNLTWSASLPAPPAAPSGLSATAFPTQKVELSWTDNADDETEYRVERKLQTDVSFTQIATLGVDADSHTDDEVNKGMSYVYRVLACNGAGCSNPSTETTATVPALGLFIGN